MDLPKPANSGTSLLNKSKQNTTMMKGIQNELKIISVTSKSSHWDLRLKYSKQDNMADMQEYAEDNHLEEYSNSQEYAETYLQEYPDLEADMQEYAEEDNHMEEYSNPQEYAETYIQGYNEEQHDELETNDQYIELKNKIPEEFNSYYDNFVKEEATSDLDIDDNDINNIIEPKDNIFNVNIKVKEFRGKESGYGKVDGIMKVDDKVENIPKNRCSRVDGIRNHYENVDKVLKHFETIKCIQESDGKVDVNSEKDVMNSVMLADEFSTLKCTVCFKAFLGEDAYNEHMKKHTTKRTSRGKRKQSSVLKNDKPRTSKWAIVKVKKVCPKRLSRNKDGEQNTTKLYKTKTHSDSVINVANSDNAKNNINFDNSAVKFEIEYDGVNTVKVDNNSSHTVKVDRDNDSSVKVDGDNDSSVKVDGDNDRSVKVDGDNDNTAVKVDGDNDRGAINENKDLLIEIPGKTKVIKLREKNTKRFRKHTIVTYRNCDENCTNDEYCTQSKECRRKGRYKKDITTRYECTLCDYKSNHKTNLEAHMLTHNRVKRFSCNICRYRCVRRSHLDQHMRTHSRTKPYSCKYCDYECVQRSQLDQHIRRHTGVKPFSCNLCGYSCTQRCHLDQHMRRHTKVMPFSCIFCGYKSVQLSHLNQHITKMHTNVHVFS
ncbi:zinc finger protein 37-like [Maniola hyperantus]|uniref:zinc finger protein 37-like n=1 Tax=Aphantopus hyperantus TaxID=2795564 RepID=UPI003749886C